MRIKTDATDDGQQFRPVQVGVYVQRDVLTDGDDRQRLHEQER